jgi:Tfp pilus assembly protein FimT
LNNLSRPNAGRRSETGLGLMEVIAGVLMALILGSVLLHFINLGWSMYRLNSATGEIAEELEKARETARTRNQQVGVVFDAQERRYGIDRNNNGRLEAAEAAELPAGISISGNTSVVFTRTGNLLKGSKEPNIVISNSRSTRNVSVSSLGSVEID